MYLQNQSQVLQFFHKLSDGRPYFLKQGMVFMGNHYLRKKFQSERKFMSSLFVIKYLFCFYTFEDLKQIIVVAEVKRQCPAACRSVFQGNFLQIKVIGIVSFFHNSVDKVIAGFVIWCEQASPAFTSELPVW